jgi:hypothetical protein
VGTSDGWRRNVNATITHPVAAKTMPIIAQRLGWNLSP